MKNLNLNSESREVIMQILEEEKKGNIKKMHTLSTIQAREAFKNMRSLLSPKPPKVFKSKDFSISNIKARYYRGINNSSKSILPVMFFFHGGGWVIGDLDTHDVICRQIVNISNFDIISVDYRLGPENRFPKAVEDVITSLNWLFSNNNNLPVDNSRIGVCGDSAGGNLAAVLCIHNRDNLKKNIKYQALVYPSTDYGNIYPSREKYDGIILSNQLIKWFEERYLPENYDRDIFNDWRLAPLKAKSLKNLPPALVAVAECDPLADEAKKYAEKLKLEGNNVEIVIFKGQIHGFLTMGKKISDAERLIKLISARMNKLLHL